jgi:hypothetical protein
VVNSRSVSGRAFLLWLDSGFEGGIGVRLSSGAGYERESALGEGVEAEVAAAFCPFVVLLGEDRPGEADDGVAVRENSDAVGTALDLAVEALVQVVRPDLPDRL